MPELQTVKRSTKSQQKGGALCCVKKCTEKPRLGYNNPFTGNMRDCTDIQLKLQ